jgi:flagellar secretion chaperone FliS
MENGMGGFGFGAAAYAKVDMDTAILAATPHKLISMLFDGALQALNEGLGAMEKQDIPSKGRALTKAIRILDEGLKSALNDKAGGELSAHLRDLYDYMVMRLLQANLQNDLKKVKEVIQLLGQIREAWAAIDEQNNRPEVLNSGAQSLNETNVAKV